MEFQRWDRLKRASRITQAAVEQVHSCAKFAPAAPCYPSKVINVNSKGKFSEIFTCSQPRDARERIEPTRGGTLDQNSRVRGVAIALIDFQYLRCIFRPQSLS